MSLQVDRELVGRSVDFIKLSSNAQCIRLLFKLTQYCIYHLARTLNGLRKRP